MEQKREQTSATKSIGIVNELGKLGRGWYDYARETKQKGGHIAWAMFGPPPEILLALDVVPIYTEQYAAAMAARQRAEESCEWADKTGYNIDICGYCRLGLGYTALESRLGHTPENPAYSGLPEPDILLGRSHCDPGYKWYQTSQHLTGKELPYFIYENLYPVPDSGHFIGDKEIDEQYVKFYRKQVEEMVAFLEKHTGKKMDLDRLREKIEVSQEMRQLWYDIYLMRRAIPAPMPTGDFMTCVFPYMTMHASDEGLDFLRRLHSEVKHRVDNKIGVVPEEKHRILWIGIPPWFHMSIFNYFEKFGGVSCIEFQYPPALPIDVDLDDPLGALAKRDHFAGTLSQHLISFPSRGEECYGIMGGCYRPVRHVMQMVEDYSIDGLVIHHITSCRNALIGHTHGRRVIRERLGLPTLFLESDMVDPRGYDEEADFRAINTFMEQLADTRK
ncbi:2-hydroxyacyl-CoA dehydratase subunit D [Chloroflexota bacterium]